MKTRKRHLTARIKPATKHALMAQLALAADEIERLRGHVECLRIVARGVSLAPSRPWYARLMWWRK
jgi:hypothetical protein